MIDRFELGVEGCLRCLSTDDNPTGTELLPEGKGGWIRAGTDVTPFVRPVTSASDGLTVLHEDTTDGDFVGQQGFLSLRCGQRFLPQSQWSHWQATDIQRGTDVGEDSKRLP